MSTGDDGEDARGYHPRGMASCLRCGHLVRVAAAGGAELELVDPERRAAGRWAELLGRARGKARPIEERRRGHRAGTCFALTLGPAPKPAVEVDGRRFLVEQDLGPQWTMPGRGRAHVLYVMPESGPEPMPGPGRLLAYRYPEDPEDSRWALWPWRDRSGYPWAEGRGLAEVAAPEPAPKPPAPPAKKPPAPKRIRIAGVPYRQLEYLGHQPVYRAWAWRVIPWGSPDDGKAEAVAIKRPGESAWRIARLEDRIGERPRP